jgi:uncharacterized protein (TIGR03067 family)
MKRSAPFVLVCIAIALGVTAGADDAATEKSQLAGEWVLSRGESNGGPLVGEQMAKQLRDLGRDALKVKVVGERMTMSYVGAPDHIYDMELFPTEEPKRLRFTTVETGGKAAAGTVLEGIYKIENAELHLCLPADESVGVPKAFEAPRGSRLTFLILRRQAEPSDAADSP